MKKLALIFLLLAIGITGCSPNTDSKPSKLSTTSEETSQPATENESEIKKDENGVMDFNAKITFKKPLTPVPEKPRIMFLGNSHIFVNDLPNVFAELSKSGEKNAYVEEYTEGRYTLDKLSDPKDPVGGEAIKALGSDNWDYVILQENAQIAALTAALGSDFYPAAKKIDQYVKKANGQTVMFMTWAYEDGYDLSSQGFGKADKAQMQTSMVENYIEVANRLDALVAPAGIAFMRSKEQHPEIELWDQEDLIHPTLAGTYLSACILYGTMYDQSPEGIAYTAGLDKKTAGILQKIAADAVFVKGD